MTPGHRAGCGAAGPVPLQGGTGSQAGQLILKISGMGMDSASPRSLASGPSESLRRRTRECQTYAKNVAAVPSPRFYWEEQWVPTAIGERTRFDLVAKSCGGSPTPVRA